ncbi:MAG: hypothetical protein ACFB15_02200 [Cyclobacteriaceae bacterium]
MNKSSIICRGLVVILLLGASCRSAKVGTAKEDFSNFYQQFLTDSSFQMQRVQFPLPGQKITAEVQDTAYQWAEDDWIMLKEFELDPTQFERNLQVTDTLATDEIYTPGAGFYFKMVFEPIKRKWYLVYLVDQGL